jgi:hypothetical protein
MKIGPPYLSMLGMNIQGDLGDTTYYRSAKQPFIAFLATTPKEQYSGWQLAQRAKWKTAARVWKNMSQTTRDEWKTACRKAKLAITAYNLFVHCMTTFDQACLDTINAQACTNLTIN